MKNIAVFFGGVSSEHDISIITGIQTILALNKNKHKVFPIYISKTGKWFYSDKFDNVDIFLNFREKSYKNVFLTAGDNVLYQKSVFIKKVVNLDSAIICCHGLNGEDGTLQGLLELSNVPYSSSGVLGSSVCMDKIIMKALFEFNNLPVTKYSWFLSEEFEADNKKVRKKIQKNLNFPLIVKPSNLGSSIGISKCNSPADLKKAIEVAKCYDNRIIVEEAVENLREINCACLGYENSVMVSELEEPISWNKFLSFEEKYLHFTNVKFEKKGDISLSEEMKAKIKKLAKTAFTKLCANGVVRVDFLIDSQTDDIYINEINTIPGSLANYLWKDFDYPALLDKLIEISLLKFDKRRKCSFSYDSNALSNFKNSKKLLKTTKNKL